MTAIEFSRPHHDPRTIETRPSNQGAEVARHRSDVLDADRRHDRFGASMRQPGEYNGRIRLRLGHLRVGPFELGRQSSRDHPIGQQGAI